MKTIPYMYVCKKIVKDEFDEEILFLWIQEAMAWKDENGNFYEYAPGGKIGLPIPFAAKSIYELNVYLQKKFGKKI